MPSDLKFNETTQIVEIVHTGVLTTENLRKSTNDGLALLADRNVKSVLIDVSGLESVEDFTEVFDLPRQYADGGLSPRVRIALVSPKLLEAQMEPHFYERFCVPLYSTNWPIDRRAMAGLPMQDASTIESNDGLDTIATSSSD